VTFSKYWLISKWQYQVQADLVLTSSNLGIFEKKYFIKFSNSSEFFL
jgi:hypothetical protein